MKIIFLGNTKYSIIGAQIIHASYPISLFVTISDQLKGREKKLVPSPVKELALKLRVPYLETNQLSKEVIAKIQELNPDYIIVEDYRLILPLELLDIPKIASINVHHSLLPKYRGPSPAPSAILNGEKISGVSIIKMAEKVDAGVILAQQEYKLRTDETTDSLLTKLNGLGGKLVTKVISDYSKGDIKSKVQDDSEATFTKMIKKEDGYFDINNPPSSEKLDRMIRAYYPWPNVWTKWCVSYARKASPCEAKIIKFYPGGLIQMEGKKPAKIEDFLRGYPNFPLKKVDLYLSQT